MEKIKLFWKWTKIKLSSDLSKESNSYSKSDLKSKILKQVQDDTSSFPRHAEFISASIQSTPCHAEFISASPKKLQYGRSMIEMIGVLAIIGVISIGGVWGINKAMTKNTANNIIEDVKLAGFIVVSELFDTLPDVDEETGLNLAGKFAQNTPYTFKAFPEGETTFEIFVPDVSYNVCMELKQRKVDWLEEIRANGKENVCKKDVMNEMSFFFNTGLNTEESEFFGACKTDAECGECGTCDGRKCVYPNNKPVRSGNSCVACPTIRLTNSTASSCHQCKDTFFAINDQCVSCRNNVYYYYATKEECLRCNKNGYNKYWIGGVYADDPSMGYCYDCIGTVSADGTECNWSCGKGKIGARNNYECKTCARGSSYAGTTHAECLNCGDGWYYVNDYCFDCNRADVSSEMTKEECLGCVRAGYNKYWYHTGNMRDDIAVGKCLTCEGTVSADGTYCNWSCEIGTIGQQGRYMCVNCGSSYYNNTTREQCLNCNDSFYDESVPRCTKCSVNNDASAVRKSDCLRCNDVGYKKYWVGTYVDDNSLGRCKTCVGTVSADGTGCIPE